MKTADNHFANALKDYRLTTAEILYHLPDHPVLLQTYIWQDFDLPPEFPKLHEFIQFWIDSIDAELYSVRVMFGDTLVPNAVSKVDFLSTLKH